MSSQASFNARGSSSAAGLQDAAQSLRNMPFFAGLSDQDFRKVSALIQAKLIGRGELILTYGGTDTNLYVLRSGRAVIRSADQSYVDRTRAVAYSGQVLNEMSFLTGRANEETIESLEKGSLWYIPRDAFLALLEREPELRANLLYPDEVKVMMERQRFKWQLPGEEIVLFRKKHPWVVISRWWPGYMALFVVAVLTLGLRDLLVEVQLLSAVPIMLLLGALFYFFWVWLDWWNDYYVVTDRRVVHREQVVFFSLEQDELPIEKIQDVTLQRTTLPQIVFNMGTITIESLGSESQVIFTDVSGPDDVTKAIALQQQHREVGERAVSREKIREELRQEIEAGRQRPGDVPSPPKIKVKKWKTPRARLSEARQYRLQLIPPSRTILKDQIIYRKHILELFKTAGASMLAVSAYSFFLLFVRLFAFDTSLAAVFSFPLVVLTILIGIILLVWLVYQYEDWHNDIFALTKDRAIDIDRKPFGLSLQRRETGLDKVQSTEVKIRSVIDTFFNIGDVIIKTGGAEGQLVFDRVGDPQQVQKDINEKLDAFRKTAKEEEARARRREVIEWIGIYDNLQRLHPKRGSELG